MSAFFMSSPLGMDLVADGAIQRFKLLCAAQIRLQNFLRRPQQDVLSMSEPESAIAKFLNQGRHVGNKKQGFSRPFELVEPFKTAGLEALITDSEDLVDDDDVRIAMNRHRKRQAHEHAAGVGARGVVNEVAESGKRDNLVEVALQALPIQTKEGGVEVHVFAACQIRMKTGAEFEQGCH